MIKIILNITNKCNSNCRYCHVSKKDKPHTMSADLLETAFKKIGAYLMKFPDEKIELIWHGGEPLTLNNGYLNEVCDIFIENCGDMLDRISQSIQTNITRMTQEHINLLRRLGIRQITTSYDPIPNIRGFGAAVDSAKYNTRFLEGLMNVEQAGFNWGIIYVVTRKSLDKPVEIFYLLTNLNLKGNIIFNPVFIDNDNAAALAIEANEFAEFLGAILPGWWRNRYRFPEVEPFKSFEKCIQQAAGRSDDRDTADNLDIYLILLPGGDITERGWNRENKTISHGHLDFASFSDIVNNSSREASLERMKEVLGCHKCNVRDYCLGKVGNDPFTQNARYSDYQSWCRAKEYFINQFFLPIIEDNNVIAK